VRGNGRAWPDAIFAQLGRVSADLGLLVDRRRKNELMLDSLVAGGLFCWTSASDEKASEMAR